MKNRMFLVAGLAAFGLFAGACQLDVERNDDGSLQIEAIIEESDIATEIALGMAAEEGNVTVDLKDGYALIAATGPSEDHPRTDSFSFRLELFVVDGHLGANVSDAKWNEYDVPQGMVEIWNEELAKELEAGAKEDPDSTLVAVEITEDELRFEFRHETEQSKS
ncbi:MAG: hypothetical protein GY720_16175 [bacterium]|nr:hypothetical protein [bacterium]